VTEEEEVEEEEKEKEEERKRRRRIHRPQYRNHSSTYKTSDTGACKTHCTISVYTTVFLKMNPWFRNM
jgi:hypothetical protein